MAHDIEPIHAEQSRIVRELFVDIADDNYVAARWCFVEGLNVDYLWLGVHALEKYMKAALLLNGRSGKGYLDGDGKLRHFGHDIVALYECVKAFASDLLPVKSEKCWIFWFGVQELRFFHRGRSGPRILDRAPL